MPNAWGDDETATAAADFETQLSAADEQRFQSWKRQYAPNDSGADYDLRGAFKAGLKPGANGHWPDTYKKPNHPTFSDESIYAKDVPALAGHWSGDKYIPPLAANTWGDTPAQANDWGDTPITEPQSSAVADTAKRVARGAVAGTGQALEAVGRGNAELGGLLGRFNDWTTEKIQGFPLTDEQKANRAEMRGQAQAQFGQPDRAAVAAGEKLVAAAKAIPTDTARDAELKARFAEGLGSAVPALASAAVNPIAPVLTMAAQSGEAERDAAIAAGDAPDVAANKAKLARVGGAIAGAIPVGPVRGAAGLIERLATRSATGAAINAATDAAQQELVDQKIDWGRVKTAGAFGAGLGLVLGVPEALALRKATGTAASHEGKTLAQAIDDIAKETGAPATDIQRQINDAVGVKPALPADATAARQAELESVLGDAATAEQARANLTLADAAQAKSLFEARAGRQADLESALTQQDAALQQQMARNQGGPVQSSESLAWLHEGDAAQQADAGVASLDSRLGAGQGAVSERARLESVRPPVSEIPADSPPAMSPQAQRMYDEHGALNPAVLFPVARAAVGGALGYAQGDTPEERVRNALLGMGFGALASPALVKRLTSGVFNSPVTKQVADLARERMTQLRLRVAPQSILPAEIRTQLRWGEQASAAVTQTGLSLSRDLEHAVNSVGNPAARAAVAPLVKDFLEGRAPASALPAPVQAAAQKVRDYVDTLSDRAVAEGVVSGSMANTFLSNRGSYLRRSYDIFLNPNFKPPAGTVDAAIAAVQKANGIARPEAEGIVAGILDQNGRANLPDFLLGRGKVAGKDVSSLVRRQDLLPEVRAMLGEVQDPILAVNQTIPRLARLIEHDATQKQVRAIGQRLGLFSDTRSLAHPTPLVAEGSPTHDALAGQFAPPEIAAAFRKEAGSGRSAFVPEVLWKTLTTATSAAKLSKTVGNPESYMPNFIGGIIANIGNGNFRYNHAAHGLAMGAEELGALRQFMPRGPVRDALRTELGELQRLGVLGQSVNSGDLLRTIETSFFGKLSNKAKGVFTAPIKAYGAIDDFNRYIAWQSERARYAKAFPGMPADELKRHAAEVVRATVPNYGEVPRIVKQLSVAGLAPSFVNFTWEVFRNTKNSVRLGLQDLQRGRGTGNAALVRAGAERLAAITAVTAAGSMWGYSKLSRDSHKITDAQDKAVRFFSPPWNKSGVLAYHTPAGSGRPVGYSNLSYLVPHSLLFQALEAGRRGSDEGRTVPEFLSALNEQFGLGNNVLLPAVTGAITGTDPKTGRPIPKTAVTPTAGDRAAYLADQAFKPLVVDWVDKFNKARSGQKGDYGRVYTVDEQMKRLLGVRAQTLDPVQAVAWKAKDLGNQLHEAEDIYRLRLKQQLPPEELQQKYLAADKARRGVAEEMTRMLNHARALGVPDEQTIAAMRDARMGPDVILGVLDGRYTPLAKDKAKTPSDWLADLRAKPAQQRAAALAQLYRDDPALGKEVVERIKASAKGTTERDKLLLGLGIGDGERATYIRQKLQDLGDVAARRTFMLELRRKGILTDRVLEQMAKSDPKAAR